MQKNKKSKTAFTLIELSLVLAVAATIVAVVISVGSGFLNTSKLASARSLTASSPVIETPGLVLWLESTLKSSFIESEVSSASGSISTWYDQNPQTDNKNNVTSSGSPPTYLKNAINGLPAVNFNGSQFLLASTTNEPNFDFNKLSIFIVSTGSGTYFAKNDINSGSNTRRKLQFVSIGFESGADTVAVAFGTSTDSNPHIRAFVSSSNTNHKYWIDNNTTTPTGTFSTTLYNDQYNTVQFEVGAAFTGNYENLIGNIGEIIIFNRDLSAVEVVDIMNYLSKKWRINLI